MAHLPEIYKSFPQSRMIAERSSLAHKFMILGAMAIPLILGRITDISWLRPESLENDFNRHALEGIRKATPPALKLTPTPGVLTAILMYFFAFVAGLAISVVAIAVFLVVQAFL